MTKPDTPKPDLETVTPLTPDITGRAGTTDEDLVTLFDDDDDEHFADGFRGGSEDDPADDGEPSGAPAVI